MTMFFDAEGGDFGESSGFDEADPGRQRFAAAPLFKLNFSPGRNGGAIPRKHFDDDFRLDPHAWFNQRENASWPVINDQSFGALSNTAPFFIT